MLPAMGGTVNDPTGETGSTSRARSGSTASGSICCHALQPAPHARAVVAIGIAELALEIGFLAGHHAVANDEGAGHECREQPEAVEGNGETDEPKKHAEVDRIAREAVGSGLDDVVVGMLVGTFEPAL